ncbi:hypothetical protein A2U01_0093701, partial [Trifolium medium]|nr:hypothetical protein [Trifolium medium]
MVLAQRAFASPARNPAS